MTRCKVRREKGRRRDRKRDEGEYFVMKLGAEKEIGKRRTDRRWWWRAQEDEETEEKEGKKKRR